MGIVELDVFDGVQDVLAGRTGVVEAALAGLLHQGGDEEVQVAHHGRFVLDPQAPGPVDVFHGLEHFFRALGVVDRLLFREGQEGRQPVGADPVETHPAVFPGLLGVGGVGVQLVGLDKKEVAGGQLPGTAAGLEGALAGQDQVDQVMVPDAGAPGVAGGAALQPAVKDGQVHVVGVILFERLFINLRHRGLLFRQNGRARGKHLQYTISGGANSTKVHLNLCPGRRKSAFAVKENCKKSALGLQ